MGIERSALTGIVREITVNYFGEKLKIRYRPDVWTASGEMEKELAREESGETPTPTQVAEELINALADGLVGWDVFEDGVEVPPTRENLKTFPNALLAHINDAINQDMYPNLRAARR